jgi:hypothetical protein
VQIVVSKSRITLTWIKLYIQLSAGGSIWAIPI